MTAAINSGCPRALSICQLHNSLGAGNAPQGGTEVLLVLEKDPPLTPDPALNPDPVLDPDAVLDP